MTITHQRMQQSERFTVSTPTELHSRLAAMLDENVALVKDRRIAGAPVLARNPDALPLRREGLDERIPTFRKRNLRPYAPPLAVPVRE
jgi:hypothetical protein